MIQNENKLLLLRVNGMTCHHCEMTLESSLKEIENIIDVTADREKKMVQIVYEAEIDMEKINSIIEENGFKVLD
jgi:copper chaperone CopZ